MATTPRPLPSAFSMSVPRPTSVKVPSPLLWKSRLAVRLEDARNAVKLAAEFVVAAGEVARRAVVDEAADEQIEPAVVVEIEPDGAGGPVAPKALAPSPAFSLTSVKVPSPLLW